MKNHILILSYKVPLEEIMKHVAEHRHYLHEFYQKGVILFSGIQCTQSGGIIIMRASEEKEVQDLITGDPFYVKGLADYESLSFEARAWQPFLAEWLGES